MLGSIGSCCRQGLRGICCDTLRGMPVVSGDFSAGCHWRLGVDTQRRKTEDALSRHGKRILALAYSYLRSRDDAEDVLQETMIRYLRSGREFNDEEHEKAWLLTVAANLSKNIIRSRSRNSGPVPEELTDEGIPVENIELRDAVSRLPEIYREVIQLFYYEDLSITETAAVLGEKESTIKSRLRRARGLLGKMMGESRTE
ncbi:MAG: sigma-70 family RNA polymerase sigma factor [Anaerovoracaceae bacterium]|nr:sigma-70 family RNA polymerase sigma factor [Anaerovoracaceae bacterium]